MNSSTPMVAAFDFDGTLTWIDTLPFFLIYLAGPIRFLFTITPMIPTLLRFWANPASYDASKRKIVRRFLSGMSAQRAAWAGRRFAERVLPKLIRSNVLSQLQEHLKKGHRCIIISASPELYLTPYAEQLGVQDVIATAFEIDAEGRLSGELAGNNCYGEEKATRLAALLGDRRQYRLTAYGNSPGDIPLLKMADTAYYNGKPFGAAA